MSAVSQKINGLKQYAKETYFRVVKFCSAPVLVLYWTGTWWSRVDDKKVKEGKRLIFPGLCSRLSCSRESAREREERETERKKDRQTRGPRAPKL